MTSIKIHVYGDTECRIDTPTKYIDDLIQQIGNDIFPLFFFTQGSAPFTVLRNLFCFLDHVARLRYGNEPDSLKKVLISGSFGVYKQIRKRYKQICPFLIQMYRHELVHHIRPFPKYIKYMIQRGNGDIRESGLQEIGFHISSDINKKLENKPAQTFEGICKFLKTESNRSNFCHLRSKRGKTGIYKSFVFNTLCFMGDVVDYLNKYKERLRESRKEQIDFAYNYKNIYNNNMHKLKEPLILDNVYATRATGSDTDLSPKKIEKWYEEARKVLYKEMFEE